MPPRAPAARPLHPAGRALIGLWAVVLAVGAGGAIMLQVTTPPKPRHLAARMAAARQPEHRSSAPVVANAASGGVVTHAASAGISAPDPALLEPAPDFDGRMLPRIGVDGRRPSQAYAASAGPAARDPGRPQVAILLEGIGLSAADSLAAIGTLPAAISLGVSPYATSLDRPGPNLLLETARKAGHETWLSLPMEPAGSPTDDEGPQALTTATDFALDARALEWSLSRLQGYVGATNALSGMRGDRFANSGAFAMVRKALTERGLLYVDAGTAPHPQTPGAGLGRHADLSLDDDPDAPDIEARLSRLEQIAEAKGSALGVAGPIRPVTLERLRAWTQGLAARGLVLVPVSALRPPTARPASDPSSPAAASPT